MRACVVVLHKAAGLIEFSRHIGIIGPCCPRATDSEGNGSRTCRKKFDMTFHDMLSFSGKYVNMEAKSTAS